MEKAVLKVEGMSCNHCVQSVTQALSDLPSVNNIQVDLEGKTASFEFDDSFVRIDTAKEAIEDQGYDVV
ncbi:MAG: copper ion binding protein [Streptococcaceae bacterium]|jgi:copper chaperone|nr:copper ion binding protein [Streptococcaceae bacterium]